MTAITIMHKAVENTRDSCLRRVFLLQLCEIVFYDVVV